MVRDHAPTVHHHKVRVGSAALRQVKTAYRSILLPRDKPTFQIAVGRSEALLGSARSFLFATTTRLWDELSTSSAASMQQRALVRLICTQATQSAAQAVDLVYAGGGIV